MAAATLTLAACTDEDDNIVSQSTPLQVQTTLTQARSVITDTAFGDGQSIGITLVDNTDGATAYEGKTEGYTNVPYTSSETGQSQTWGAQNPIMLSPTVGKAVAYYPYAQANADYKAIPVTAQGQTDYMYSGWTDADGISNADAKATFVMQHALSAIRITVKKGSYSQTGSLSAISLTSDGFGVSGTLNAATGALAGVAAAEVNSTMNPDFATANITAEGLSNILMVVPTGVAEAKPMTVTVTIDGKQYAAQANMTEPVTQGKIYSCELTLNNTQLNVTKISVTPWNEKETVKDDLQVLTWNTAPNGVYAVSAEGNPVVIEDADESCIAIAVIAKDAPTSQSFWIEKYETKNITSIKAAYEEDKATNTDYTYFYWGEYGSDNTSITNYTKPGWASGSYGYLPKADGTYTPTSNPYLYLSGDYTTWTSGALSDYNGKSNTITLQTATDTDSYTQYANMATWCKIFNKTASENQGYTDWYIPACGQLGLIYLNITDINIILEKIGGTTFTIASYLNSSEDSANYGWRVDFGSGYISSFPKYSIGRVRFVRDLYKMPTGQGGSIPV